MDKKNRLANLKRQMDQLKERYKDRSNQKFDLQAAEEAFRVKKWQLITKAISEYEKLADFMVFLCASIKFYKDNYI
jgi:uncharacterized protein (UPF0335 family)